MAKKATKKKTTAKPKAAKVEVVKKAAAPAPKKEKAPAVEKVVEEKAPELSFEQLKARERSERRAKVAKPSIRRP